MYIEIIIAASWKGVTKKDSFRISTQKLSLKLRYLMLILYLQRRNFFQLMSSI